MKTVHEWARIWWDKSLTIGELIEAVREEMRNDMSQGWHGDYHCTSHTEEVANYKVTVTAKATSLKNLVWIFQYAAKHVRDGNTVDYGPSFDNIGCEWSIKYDLPPEGFKVGAKVKKVSGYAFHGIIRAVFQNSIGQWRYVVEHEKLVGLLHIFNAEQLDYRQ